MHAGLKMTRSKYARRVKNDEVKICTQGSKARGQNMHAGFKTAGASLRWSHDWLGTQICRAPNVNHAAFLSSVREQKTLLETEVVGVSLAARGLNKRCVPQRHATILKFKYSFGIVARQLPICKPKWNRTHTRFSVKISRTGFYV